MREWEENVAHEPTQSLVLLLPSDHEVLVVVEDADLDDGSANLLVCRCQSCRSSLILATLSSRPWQGSRDHIVDKLTNVVAVDCDAHDAQRFILDAPIS